MRRLKTLLLFSVSSRNRTLSYNSGWVKYFLRHPGFNCFAVNVSDQGRLRYAIDCFRSRFSRFDAVVMLHSCFSNSRALQGVISRIVCERNIPKVFFIGNEYKLLPEKMDFCDELGVNLLITMNPDERAQNLYRRRLGCEVACIPSAGLDPEIFTPGPPLSERPIDIGYRSFRSPIYLGHDERGQIAEYFSDNASSFGLKVDISLKPEDRLAEDEWAEFLRSCKGQLGTEAGGDYFEIDDHSRKVFIEKLKPESEVSLKKVIETLYANYENPIPVRTISGRIIEAAAAGTVQILFSGQYSGCLKPDVHYIELKKDFSNIKDVLARFRDDYHCQKIVENSKQLALHQFTYEKLLDQFYLILGAGFGLC